MKERQKAENRPLPKDAPTASHSTRKCCSLSSHLVALGLRFYRDTAATTLDRDVLCIDLQRGSRLPLPERLRDAGCCGRKAWLGVVACERLLLWDRDSMILIKSHIF